MARKTSRLVLLTLIIVVIILLVNRIPSNSKIKISTTSSDVSTEGSKPEHLLPVSFDWSSAHQFFPPKTIKSLPSGQPHSLPLVQAPATAFNDPTSPDPRREAVVAAFKRSYSAYKKQAWMRDELSPVTGGGKDTFGGWGATLVDALDTLWIMDLKSDFFEAANAITAIDYSKTSDSSANLFETTIRHLGGLLSAYDLSGDEALLNKAIELGDMLYMGFDTPNRLPGFWLNFKDAKYGRQVAGTRDPSAAPASLCLEFTRLSQITGDSKYYSATDRVTRFLEGLQDSTKLPGMWPTVLDFRNEEAQSSAFTIGALADSLYEYLPKMHALLGGLDDTYEKLYRAASKTIKKNLLFRPMLPDKKDILFSGDARVHESGNVELIPESQHLTCFAGGMFGLGGKLFGIADHVFVGERLARGCGWAYGQFPTGVMPEIFGLIPCASLDECEWDEQRWLQEGERSLNKGWRNARDPKYILRPEAIESIFLLYRMTGNEELRDLAWDMWQGIAKSTKTEIAYSAIRDVTVVGETKKTDSMESFWLAETLKYFYLIFSPINVISLDEYVFNTEAHPFKRPEQGMD